MAERRNEKILPQALDAERAVLGGLLMNESNIEEVVDILRKENFYLERHQLIYEAVCRLSSKGDPIDIISVSNELEKSGKLDHCGGRSYIDELAEISISLSNTVHYSKIVQEKSTMRELIRISGNLMTEAYQEVGNADRLLQMLEKEVFRLTQNQTKEDFVAIGDIAGEVVNTVDAMHDRSFEDKSTRTHFSDLDEMTTGFKPADYFIIAGATSSGKTAYALSLATSISIPPAGATPKGVAIFSLEMSAEQLVMRILSTVSKIDSHKMRQGNLSKSERGQLSNTIPKLVNAPIYIDDSASQNMLQMRSKMRKLMRRTNNGVGMVIIDYLQLVRGEGGLQSREREIAEISHGIKAMARELKCPVIALSQLSRKVESRPGEPRPRLSDLRESGAIEQDADGVMFVYRPEYYRIPKVTIHGQEYDSDGIAEIILAKQRNGPVGSFHMRFNKQYTSFEQLDIDHLSPAGFNPENDDFDEEPWNGNNFGGA